MWICARGFSRSMSSLRASSFADSGDTSHSSSLASASRRAHTEPIAPVAPTTIALPCITPSVVDLDQARADRIASCAAHSAADAL